MIKRAIQRWDAVDVKMENGTKQFGYVVDIDNDGLAIDFGNGAPVSVSICKIRKPRTTYCTIPDSETSENCRGSMENHHEYKLEAVVQTSPASPYTWYPARVLFKSDLHFSLVELLIDSHKQEYVLPRDHIRQPYSFENYLQCQPVWTAFRKMRTPVHGEFVLDDRVQTLWLAAKPRRKIIGVLEGFLYYLMEDKPETEKTLRNQLRLLKKTVELCKPALDSTNGSLADSSQHPPTEDGNKCPDINKAIPPEIMLKIFKWLDTEQQFRARPVCAKWNVLLCSPQITSEVRIQCTKGTVDRDAESCRKIAACLHKNICDKTQKLTLTGCGTLQVLTFIKEMLNFLRSEPLETLIFSDWEQELGDFDDFDGPHRFGFELIFGKICRCLVFQNVTVDVTCDFPSKFEGQDDVIYFYPVPEKTLSIHIASARIDQQSPSRSSDFWNILEECCPAIDLESSIVPAAFQAAMVMDRNNDEEVIFWTGISQILYGFESYDPRASEIRRSMFRLNDEFQNFSAIDARKLYRLTLNILDKVFRMSYCPLTGKFAADLDE